MDTNYRRMTRATQSLSEYPDRVEMTWTVNKTEGVFLKRKLRKTNSNPEEFYTKSPLESKANKDESFGNIHPDMYKRRASASTVEVQQQSLSYFTYLGDERNHHRRQFYELYNLSRRNSIKPSQNLQMIQENGNWNGLQPKVMNESSLVDPKADGISVTEYQVMKGIDCCTCMCCVRGLIYHLTKDNDNEGNLELCSCTEPSMNCLIQWSMIGVLTIFMPCLVLYPLLKGGFKIFKYLKRSLKKKHKLKIDRTS